MGAFTSRRRSAGAQATKGGSSVGVAASSDTFAAVPAFHEVDEQTPGRPQIQAPQTRRGPARTPPGTDLIIPLPPERMSSRTAMASPSHSPRPTTPSHPRGASGSVDVPISALASTYADVNNLHVHTQLIVPGPASPPHPSSPLDQDGPPSTDEKKRRAAPAASARSSSAAALSGAGAVTSSGGSGAVAELSDEHLAWLLQQEEYSAAPLFWDDPDERDDAPVAYLMAQARAEARGEATRSRHRSRRSERKAEAHPFAPPVADTAGEGIAGAGTAVGAGAGTSASRGAGASASEVEVHATVRVGGRAVRHVTTTPANLGSGVHTSTSSQHFESNGTMYTLESVIEVQRPDAAQLARLAQGQQVQIQRHRHGHGHGHGRQRRGVSRQQLAALPVNTVDKVGDSLPEEYRSCTVCLMDYEAGDRVRILPCLHRFHQLCVDTWLQSSVACPNCKTPITSR